MTLVLTISETTAATTCLTLWDALAKQYNELIKEHQYITIQGFETTNKGQYDNTSLPFILKLYGSSANIQTLGASLTSTPKYLFNFIKIKDIPKLPMYATVDILGVISAVEKPIEVTTRAGNSYVYARFSLIVYK